MKWIKNKSKSGLTHLKAPHLESTDRHTLPCWECTNCETLVALSASVVLPFSHLCPNLWHTDRPCTAVCYSTLNRNVSCLMTGCCCSKAEQKCEECMCAPPQQNGETHHKWATCSTRASGMEGIQRHQQWCHLSVLLQAAFLFPCISWQGCYLHGSCSTLVPNIKHLEVKLSSKGANIPQFHYADMCAHSCYTNSIVRMLACGSCVHLEDWTQCLLSIWIPSQTVVKWFHCRAT